MDTIIPLDVRLSNNSPVGQNIGDRVRPRVLCNLYEEGCGKDVVFLISHPAINFLYHYLLEPLRSRGIAAAAVTTRHTNNDSSLLMERVIQDVGAGVKFLRERGYQRVILIGNSGGGSLMSLYQSQAETLTITSTPDGRPFDIIPEDLPKADAIALLSAHRGRHLYFRESLDPSMLCESDFLSTDPALDMYNTENGPKYSEAWLEGYYQAQSARHQRLTNWVEGRLRELEALGGEADDQGFVIHRTYAKPSTLDPTIDPNDRPLGDMTIYGKSKSVNYSAGVLGRFTTLRSFMSQWSTKSLADGPARLAETTVPCLNVEYSADAGCLPRDTAPYTVAAGARGERYLLKGAGHFPFLQQDGDKIIADLADTLVDWARAH